MNHPRSGGPRTEAGKAKCAQNAVKHGATSTKLFVLANESPEAWAALLAATIRDYAPATETEHTYVEAIAFALWRLRRIWAVQTCAINLEMDQQASNFDSTFAGDENVRRTLAIQALTADEQALARLIRYETTLQRAHDRAVRNLRNLREMRTAQAENPEIAKQTPEPLSARPALTPTTIPSPLKIGQGRNSEAMASPPANPADRSFGILTPDPNVAKERNL